MADVQIQQTPERGGGSTVAWVVVVLLLVAVIVWFVFMRGDTVAEEPAGVDVNITAPAPSGDAGGTAPAPSEPAPPGNP